MRESYFQQPSVMRAQQHFSIAPNAEIQRSRFDRSHAVKTTFDAGKLVPIFLDEVLPGDTFHLHTTNFTRQATLLKPYMDNLYMDIHYFFVPNRLVWGDFVYFMGERQTPEMDPNDFVPPTQPWHPANTPDLNQSIGRYFGYTDRDWETKK